MPELPEVEIMTRNAQRWCAGRRLCRVECLDPALSLPAAPPTGPWGLPWRRGKYLCLPLQEEGVWMLHFRMTGKLVRIAPGAAGRAQERVRFWLDDGAALALVDPRRLGSVAWFSRRAEAEAFLEGLGPEPWPEVRSGAWWAERLGGLRVALKPALMRQDRVAGLGNIAASEICWRAGLDPHRSAAGLDAAAWAAVAAAVPAFIDHVLAAEAGEEIAYLHEGKAARTAPSPFAVYGRAGEACRRDGCGGRLVRGVQGGRATFGCPRCQV